MQRDPEQIEVHYLTQFADFDNAHILEIGAGDGRLTWRYAHLACRVTAIEPAAERLANAAHPPELRNSVTFTRSHAEMLPFPNEIFDGAILAWSL